MDKSKIQIFLYSLYHLLPPSSCHFRKNKTNSTHSNASSPPLVFNASAQRTQTKRSDEQRKLFSLSFILTAEQSGTNAKESARRRSRSIAHNCRVCVCVCVSEFQGVVCVCAHFHTKIPSIYRTVADKTGKKVCATSLGNVFRQKCRKNR